MKIDKRRPGHWLLLLGFAAMGVLGLVLRLLGPRRGRNRVLFYGHRLNGNLWPIYQRLAACPELGLVPVFLTLDRHDAAKLRAEGVHSIWACSFRAAVVLAGANAVITSHGLHSLQYLLTVYQRMGMRFFDVWHAIPYKGFDADDFHLQHRYDEIWVPSPLMLKLYLERYGFAEAPLKVTGFARTDRLVRQDEDLNVLKRKFGLEGSEVGKIILFAPTWKQDSRDRSVYPFGTDEQTFLKALSDLAVRTQSTVVMRTHHNSGNLAAQAWDRVVQRPSIDYPDTEGLLLVSDILVCDWSSIAIDWLLLERPTVFLDVEPPFAKGFSLDSSYRFGEIVHDCASLFATLTACLEQPSSYHERCGKQMARIRQSVYGEFADGDATTRCIERLREGVKRS